MNSALDVDEIRELLPHRFPMLLVDRITEVQPGKRIVGIKNVTVNEPFFPGHFPGQAVMPGVIIIESMAQIAGLMIVTMPEHKGKLAYIGSIDSARFRRPVVPGDTLRIEANAVRLRDTFGKVKMEARVEGEVVAECEMTFALKQPRTPTTSEASRV
jgi:3-hydroxyacyl-[acyl-carrier-protein] dehydratase